MKRLLISGGTGTIGSSLVRIASEKGLFVTVLVRKGSPRIDNILKADNVEIIECNLDDYKNLSLDKEYDSFIHLAWDKTFGASRDNTDIQMLNIQYTLDAVRLASRCGCKKFIGLGSQAEYGVSEKALSVDSLVNPESGYGIAKFAAGKMSELLCKQLGLQFNWIRVLSVYGPNDAEFTLISYVINSLKSGVSPELTKCEQIWDYIYSDDASEAILSIEENGVDGRYYPLGCGEGRPLRDYIEDIKDVIGADVPLLFGAKDYYPHQPMYLVSDNECLFQDTGWKPKYSFREGISKIV